MKVLCDASILLFCGGWIGAVFGGIQEGGFESLALTVDATWYGNRERDIRQKFTIPPAYTAQQATDTWHFQRAWDKNTILRFSSISLKITVSRDVLLQGFKWRGLPARCLTFDTFILSLKFNSPLFTVHDRCLTIAFSSPLITRHRCGWCRRKLFDSHFFLTWKLK